MEDNGRLERLSSITKTHSIMFIIIGSFLFVKRNTLWRKCWYLSFLKRLHMQFHIREEFISVINWKKNRVFVPFSGKAEIYLCWRGNRLFQIKRFLPSSKKKAFISSDLTQSNMLTTVFRRLITDKLEREVLSLYKFDENISSMCNYKSTSMVYNIFGYGYTHISINRGTLISKKNNR